MGTLEDSPSTTQTCFIYLILFPPLMQYLWFDGIFLIFSLPFKSEFSRLPLLVTLFCRPAWGDDAFSLNYNCFRQGDKFIMLPHPIDPPDSASLSALPTPFSTHHAREKSDSLSPFHPSPVSHASHADNTMCSGRYMPHAVIPFKQIIRLFLEVMHCPGAQLIRSR